MKKKAAGKGRTEVVEAAGTGADLYKQSASKPSETACRREDGKRRREGERTSSEWANPQ